GLCQELGSVAFAAGRNSGGGLSVDGTLAACRGNTLAAKHVLGRAFSRPCRADQVFGGGALHGGVCHAGGPPLDGAVELEGPPAPSFTFLPWLRNSNGPLGNVQALLPGISRLFGELAAVCRCHARLDRERTAAFFSAPSAEPLRGSGRRILRQRGRLGNDFGLGLIPVPKGPDGALA